MQKLNCDFLKVAESKCTNTATFKWSTKGKNQESENNHNNYKREGLLDPNPINPRFTHTIQITECYLKGWIEANKWQTYSMQTNHFEVFSSVTDQLTALYSFTGWPLITPAVFMLEIFAYGMRLLDLPEIQFHFFQKQAIPTIICTFIQQGEF